jgi:hypothetical protein
MPKKLNVISRFPKLNELLNDYLKFTIDNRF